MKSESPEHVVLNNYPTTDLGSVEEASNSLRQKEKEESKSEYDYDWVPPPRVLPSWWPVWSEPNEDWTAESLNEENENDSDGSYGYGSDCSSFAMEVGDEKKEENENDSNGSYGYAGDCSSSAMEVDDEKKEEIIKKLFKYIIRLRQRTTPFDQPESYILEDLEKDVPRILQQNPDLNEDALPESYVTSCIIDQIYLEESFFIEHECYKAVKRLYENIPYVTCRDSEEEIRKKIDLTVKPFSYFNDYYFRKVVGIYKGLLESKERLFHPLIRKSFKDEFFSLVDIEEKLGERDLIKSIMRSEYGDPLYDRVFEEISRTEGLRDEYYEYCCEQIELQQEFDFCLLQNLGTIKDLSGDEKFKKLNPELVDLSLKASIKAHQKFKRDTRWYTTYLELLEKHSKKETDDIDKMLIEFCTNFPCIFDLPLDKAPDSAMEERFKDIIDNMKKMCFPGIADHYAIGATLLYMKRIFFEGRYEPSWPTAYHNAELVNVIMTTDIVLVHEHLIYDRVFRVDYLLA